MALRQITSGIAVLKDIEGARDWFERCVGTGDESFKSVVAEAEKAVTNDLHSPATREEIWKEARRFQQEIFPAPRLTKALLRARRLGLT